MWKSPNILQSMSVSGSDCEPELFTELRTAVAGAGFGVVSILASTLTASNSAGCRRGHGSPYPLSLQQESQLDLTGGPSGPSCVLCTHLLGHRELFPGVPACWTLNTQEALGCILETTKAISLLESVLLYLLICPPAGESWTLPKCQTSLQYYVTSS